MADTIQEQNLNTSSVLNDTDFVRVVKADGSSVLVLKTNLGISGAPPKILTIPGNLLTGTSQVYFDIPADGTLGKVSASVGTAPTGADLEIDVNKNGTTIFTTQTKRPIIPAGNTSDTSETPDVTAVLKFDRISIDIDQIGSTVGGADLSISIEYTPS